MLKYPDSAVIPSRLRDRESLRLKDVVHGEFCFPLAEGAHHLAASLT